MKKIISVFVAFALAFLCVPSVTNAADLTETEIDLSELDLQNGESVEIGDFCVSFLEVDIYNPLNTTHTYTKASTYAITNNKTHQDWYKVVQKTNYSYNKTNYVWINKANSKLSVTKLVNDASYSITENNITNSGTYANYKIGVKMKLGSKTLNISDTVHVYPNGQSSFEHNQW